MSLVPLATICLGNSHLFPLNLLHGSIIQLTPCDLLLSQTLDLTLKMASKMQSKPHSESKTRQRVTAGARQDQQL
jgi:hypothetical protein